jgi:hypothetical protein
MDKYEFLEHTEREAETMTGAVNFLRALRDVCKDQGTNCDGCPVLKFCLRTPETMTDQETTEIIRIIMTETRTKTAKNTTK